MCNFKPLETLRRVAMRFHRNTAGNFSIIFAVSILPIALMIGVATDYANAGRVHSMLQSAVDAATLAATKAASEGITDKDELEAIALKSLQANTSNADIGGVTIQVFYDPDTDEVRVTASTSTKTTFMKIAGIDTVDISVDAAAVAAGQDAEVSVVVDVTGSMWGSKISNLKTAANTLVDTLLDPAGKDKGIRVALVPYSDAVNIGLDAKNELVGAGKNNWTSFWNTLKNDLPAEATSRTERNRVDDYLYKVQRGLAYTNTNTCVTERVGKEKKNEAASLVTSPVIDMTTSCPAAKVVPLTVNPRPLKTQISNLMASGMTAGHIGLAWGWNTLSPKIAPRIWPDEPYQPGDYPKKAGKPGKDEVLKVLVLMTDGEFNTSYVGGSSVNQTDALCDTIKAKGVLIYTVGFQAPYSANQMLRACASDPDMAFKAENGAELEAAFRRIASETKAMRLSM